MVCLTHFTASEAGSDTSKWTGTDLGSKVRSAFTAPSKIDCGAFVHGTKFKHFKSILQQGLRAMESAIFMINEIRPDGRVPGLKDPPEVLIFIDEEKARRHGMEFDYDPAEGTWLTKGIDGVIRPWFFQRVVDQRPCSRGNVLFQSKDDPVMAIPMRDPPRRLLHATYWENIPSILREGIVPAKNPMSETRRAFGDLLRGAEDHVYAVEPHLARANSQPRSDQGEERPTYRINVAGLERPADALITIDTRRAAEFGVDVVQASERSDTVFILGSVPPEAIIGVEANVPVDLPEHLLAKIVDPRCFEEIPVIDLSADEDTVVEQLRYACEVVGFMQVVGHGVSEDLWERLLEQQKAFFDMPAEKKLALSTNTSSPVRGYFGKGGENLDNVKGEAVNGTVPTKKVVDNKEGFDANAVPWSRPPHGGFLDHIFGLEAPLPAELPGLHEAMEAYQVEMFNLSRRLLRLMARVIGLRPDFFEAHLTHPVATHRLLHYWPVRDFQREIGVGPHTDYGLLTILRQDLVGGLQVLNARDMCWVHAVPLEGAYVVNIGDMLARWTNNRFKSTVHRVVNLAATERYSCPFFLEPNLDSVIRPAELCDGPGGIGTDEEVIAETILERFYIGAGMLREEHRAAWRAAREQQQQQQQQQRQEQ